MWCITVKRCFIYGTFNGMNYNEFLSETLSTLLNKDEMLLSARLALWFQHDDWSVRNLLIVSTKLNKIFYQQ